MMTSDETKKKVTQLVDPKEEFIRVRNLRKVRNGGVMVETTDKFGADRIRENVKLRESGLKTLTPKGNRPKIMIYDVPEGELEEVCNGIWQQNPTNRVDERELKDGFKLIKEIAGRQRGKRHWVVECSPEVRNWLRTSEKLFIEWNSCRVKV